MGSVYDLILNIAGVTPQTVPLVCGFNFTDCHNLRGAAGNFHVFASGLKFDGLAVVVKCKSHESGVGVETLLPVP